MLMESNERFIGGSDITMVVRAPFESWQKVHRIHCLGRSIQSLNAYNGSGIVLVWNRTVPLAMCPPIISIFQPFQCTFHNGQPALSIRFMNLRPKKSMKEGRAGQKV